MAADPFAPLELDADAEAIQVLGDELVEQGDLRGESIALAFHDPPAWEAWRDEHDTELLGATLASMIAKEIADVEWRHGLVERVRFYPWPYDYANFTDALGPALTGPALRLLRAVECGALETNGDLNGFWDHLPAMLTLHAIRVGGATHRHGDEHQISWLGAGHVGLGASIQPNLRELWCRGSWPDFDGLESETLESLTVVSSTLSPDAVRDIVRAPLPCLTRLELATGDGEYGPSAALDDFSELLGGGRFPNLVHLGICNAPFTNELVPALARSAILPRLRSIDLALGVLDPDGAAALIAVRDRFAHLESIELGDNPIPQAVREELARALPAVRFARDGWWRSEIKSRRYVSITE
jgi:hypothetical protein